MNPIIKYGSSGAWFTYNGNNYFLNPITIKWFV